MNYQNKVEVWVYNHENEPLRKANVELSSENSSVRLKLNPWSGAYELLQFKPGRYAITVSAEGLLSQERSVFIGNSGISETFVLGKKGMPFYYRGTVQVPFKPIDHLFAIVFQAPEAKDIKPALSLIEKRYRVKPVKADKNYEKHGVFLYEYPETISADAKQEFRNTLLKQGRISMVAPVLRQSVKNVALLTDEIIVRFKGNIEKGEVEKIAKELDLGIMRSIPYAGNAYQFKVRKGNNYEVLAVCDRLVAMGIVEYAEPNLYHTYEEDTITPNNYLFPEQWDHPLINTPDAWQVLNDHLGVARRFGSPDVLVAVVDSGVNTAHLEFSGNVSNGQPKIFSTFDFVNMVANNNTLTGSHGTNCASASVGYTSVSSVAGGVPDGTVGVAGNCRLLGIRRGGSEADYADMYIWAGGINPNSSRAGFPAVLSKGADVITSSFGAGFTAPIAGVMKDAFDYLTTYGRGGKGVILTFSVGNYASNINFHLQRPWAAYGKTFSCGASSLANDGTTEVIAAYSGSGTLLNFVAPSHDAYVGSSPFHNPPANYGAWTATVLNGVSDDDGNVPRNRQAQTTLSANVAAGATSITVASAAGMAIGQAILIEGPAANISPSEARRITNIVANTITFTPALSRAHNNGAAVVYGNRDYQNAFGGTSYATPVCAGLAALMLSVNSSLTWIEVRELIRETATKIDPNNTNAVGRWVDTMGRISTDPAYTGPFFSQFYGYGRINAVAAVTAARDYGFGRDIYIRDNMADAGMTTAGSPHWHGVDIWVRNSNDGVVPASYATDANAVHLPPFFGQNNFLNIRYKNRGGVTSYPFYIRAYIAHYGGTEFIYPDNFIPTVRPNGTIPNPLTFGTYLIGEQLVNPVNAGQDGHVVMEWAQHLIPPKQVLVSGMMVNWHPCLLVEVSPHDGFTPTGNHVWNNNNLAQKNISINYDDSDNASMVMIGNAAKGKAKKLKLVIAPEAKSKQRYFLHFTDRKINQELITYARKNPKLFELGKYKEAAVVWVKNTATKISFEISNVGITPLVIGLGAKNLIDNLSLAILQYTGTGVSGSYGIEFRLKKQAVPPKGKQLPQKKAVLK